MTITNKKIDISKLHRATTNARQIGKTKGIDTLAASIKSEGLLQPLVVYKEGAGYAVADGARRLAALHFLANAGDWNAPVDCRVTNRETANDLRAMSLAANVTQLPMHPIEQAQVVGKIHRDGYSAATIALRFGQDESAVEKVLRLNRLALPIRAAYASGKISEKIALALATSEDKHHQRREFDRLPHKIWNEDATCSVIVTRLRKAKAPRQNSGEIFENHRLFVFVADEYQAAGGELQGDLLTPSGQRKADAALVRNLAKEKLAAMAGQERERVGASWDDVSIDRAYDDFTGFDYWDETCEELPMTLVGVIAGVALDGSGFAELVVRSEDFDAWELSQARDEDSGPDDEDAPAAAPTLEAAPEVDPETATKPPSRQMDQDCATALSLALGEAIAADEMAGLDVLLAQWMARHAAAGVDILTPRLNLDLAEDTLRPFADAMRSTENGVFGALAEMDLPEKLRLLSALVGQSVWAGTKDYMAHPGSSPKRSARLVAERVNLDMHTAWSQEARRDYLNRMTKADLIHAVIKADEDRAAALMKEPKTALVDLAEQERWLPEYLEGCHVAEEVAPVAIAAE